MTAKFWIRQIGKNDTIDRFLFTVFDSIYTVNLWSTVTVSADCWPTVGRQVTDSRIWEPLFTIAQIRVKNKKEILKTKREDLVTTITTVN